jgi:hypothetical protein
MFRTVIATVGICKIFYPLMVEEEKKLRQLVYWVPRARADAAPS